jgi:2-C-methyl-D-erythritol 4-phosphate cytidylyltransferase
MTNPNDCYAIVPAAGSGSRFGSPVPKQFASLGGQTILQRSLAALSADSRIVRVVIASAAANSSLVIAAAEQSPFAGRVDVVEGGLTRQQSVLNALRFLRSVQPSLVAVHDAARPLLSAALLSRVLDEAYAHGAALPVLPVADTLHRLSDGSITETLKREALVFAQTPQCFRFDWLIDSLERAVTEGVDGTDEAAVVSRYGHDVRAVEGDSMNFKITLPEDIDRAERFLEARR